jgi:transporter family protein
VRLERANRDKSKEAKMDNWFLWTVLAMITFGAWGFFPKLAVSYISPQSAIIYQVIGGLLVGIIGLASVKFKPDMHPMGILYALLTGITGVLGSRGQISIVVSLTALYPIITILLAIIFLHETLVLKQYIGLGFALAAIFLLTG